MRLNSYHNSVLLAQEKFMTINDRQQDLLRKLPGVDHILEYAHQDAFFDGITKSVLVMSARMVIESLRQGILDQNSVITEQYLERDQVMQALKGQVAQVMRPNLKRVINATGVVVHTNLGRSLLADEVCENLIELAKHYSNLEYDLSQGLRGSRYVCVQELICELSGAQAAMVVNNNAAAVLLCLDTLAKGRKVIVSRGELVEIGGSFRVPDVMAKSGGILREVGATNRTHLRDYENAVENDTALLLKVHTSNYSIIGFTAAVALADLVKLGAKYHLPVMEDLGSGTFVDFSRYGLMKEPTIQESVATGADLITFSGDKLLGGPQAGIIVGKKEIVDKIKQNPLTRALRIDKLTLAALEITLRLYRDEQKAVEAIPTLRMLTLACDQIEGKARRLEELLSQLNQSRLHVKCIDRPSRAGGGALPLLEIPSKCVAVSVDGLSANSIEEHMRANFPPIIGRIEEDFFVMDLRTVLDDEPRIIAAAFEQMLKRDIT